MPENAPLQDVPEKPLDPGGEPSMLRLALISTPRSGNTWLRALLAAIFDLEQIAAHFPDEIDWENLPRRCVIQIHWGPKPWFRKRLQQHGVRVVVLARHPLDVLMSWLNHTYYVHQDGRCLGEGVCNECKIVGVLPRNETFLDYARSEQGQLLLCYSPRWWEKPGVLRVRYEDLVAEPEVVLGRLADQLDEPVRRPITETIDATSVRRLKHDNEVWQYQYWQGKPGLWRAMLPAPEARAFAEALTEPFGVLGYDCDADETLEASQADQNWLQLQLDSTREHLRLERAKHRQTANDLATLKQTYEHLHHWHWIEQQSRTETRLTLDAAQAPVNETELSSSEN